MLRLGKFQGDQSSYCYFRGSVQQSRLQPCFLTLLSAKVGFLQPGALFFFQLTQITVCHLWQDPNPFVWSEKEG